MLEICLPLVSLCLNNYLSGTSTIHTYHSERQVERWIICPVEQQVVRHAEEKHRLSRLPDKTLAPNSETRCKRTMLSNTAGGAGSSFEQFSPASGPELSIIPLRYSYAQIFFLLRHPAARHRDCSGHGSAQPLGIGTACAIVAPSRKALGLLRPHQV